MQQRCGYVIILFGSILFLNKNRILAQLKLFLKHSTSIFVEIFSDIFVFFLYNFLLINDNVFLFTYKTFIRSYPRLERIVMFNWKYLFNMLTFDARRLVDFERLALVCVRVSRRASAPVCVSICVRECALFGQKRAYVVAVCAYFGTALGSQFTPRASVNCSAGVQ